jgi:multiple sugar transport system ATP-binding protein
VADVKLNQVGKSYDGAVTVVRDVSLQIADGEFCVFVGPSGCGKSTLLRMVAGLEDITGGEMHIGGRRVNELAPSERNVAMVFQNYALYPHMDVATNIGFGLRLAGLKKPEIEARVRRIADILQIQPLLERKPKSLSGGQRQRVAIGRALVRDPGASPRCSCSTSRCPTSTPRCARRPASRSRACIASTARPARSTSRTTRSRR